MDTVLLLVCVIPYIHLHFFSKYRLQQINLNVFPDRYIIFKNTWMQYLREIHHFGLCKWTSDWNWKHENLKYLDLIISFYTINNLIIWENPLNFCLVYQSVLLVYGGWKLVLSFLLGRFRGPISSHIIFCPPPRHQQKLATKIISLLILFIISIPYVDTKLVRTYIVDSSKRPLTDGSVI